MALEGLDGITIPSLWIRLESRQPSFPLQLDEPTKEFLWKSLISNTELRFYEQPHEREDVVLFDRFEDVDPETGIEIKHNFVPPKDIYPIDIVENKAGIQGSCALYKRRTDITKHVRSTSLTPLVNLQEAIERYGRKLVIVASQRLRFRSLIGSESDPDLTLTHESYCVLEKVGRARWQGELQKDLHGQSFKIDARKLHYLRKSLVKHGLISMQSHCTRVKSGQQQHSILLQLKRFHVNRRSKYDLLMEYISNLLQESPGKFTTVILLKDQINVNEHSLKRALQYMQSAKLIEVFHRPLEDLDPSAGPCLTKKGSKVQVRCVKLLKPYSKKSVDDDDDDDEDDEDYTGEGRAIPPVGRIMEHDVLSQAYHIVLSCGSKGIPQSGIGLRMNVGKLESRMICRRLERAGLIKGFMEDVGRQRTTKFISHKFVDVSDRLQLFVKEQERNKLLCSSAPQTSDAVPLTPSTSAPAAKQNTKTAAKKRQNSNSRKGTKGGKEAGPVVGVKGVTGAHEGLNEAGGNLSRTVGTVEKKGTAQSGAENPSVHPAHSGPESPSTAPHPATSSEAAGEASVRREDDVTVTPGSCLPPSRAPAVVPHNHIVEVKDIFKPKNPKMQKQRNACERTHETYRLLRRKNLIVEAVHNFKIIDGLFQLQKMINDDEKQDGFSAKCCKKTILRLIHCLSREGLLKLYSTTIVQDGVTKKVDLIVHPSVHPNDERVTQAIEQMRFRISSSYSAIRVQQAEEKAKEREKLMMTSGAATGQKSKTGGKEASRKHKDEFIPKAVRGLGKRMGFQPKMPRLRVVHSFLWYLVYGHLQKPNPADCQSSAGPEDGPHSSGDPASASVASPAADCTQSELDTKLPADDEEEEEKGEKDDSQPDDSEAKNTVHVDEDSWKRFIPPVRVHKDFGSGWAMVSDVLLCLPLSVFIQFTQVNYKVDGLEEYLNDPVKQHYLIRNLPSRVKRQLLFKRKYIFAFHENLQKLVYMGLLHFGPVKKFKEKDQVFVYVKRNISIVDTTNAEPHYWLVTESADKPFERRHYTFNTAEDVENYWFDLMCVVLNTPLGVIRHKRDASDEEKGPSFPDGRIVFVGLLHLLQGSEEVCDDGSVPGDGKGAGGLDSKFFAHLKRNWFWTSHLLSCRTTPSGLAANETKIRLKSLLSKNALQLALKAGGSTSLHYVTAKQPLKGQNIQFTVEPASRNQRVVGGKGMKRKRSKKEVVKAPRKKRKEVKKRSVAHDEADHRALKMMTRQRVYWSVQEDSLMMLCRVASHLLNSKLKRPFIPFCVIRDLLHAEFEISMDKTSLAVGRRTRYILKNPQTLLNYRVSLAEVHEDKALMKVLEESKPTNQDNPEDCVKAFSKYVALLRQKFSASLGTCNKMLPDTKQQLFAQFRVSAIHSGRDAPYKDVLNSTEDIHAIVLDNLIQSTLAMTNNQMKSSRSFQTFQLYSKYNQELLCKVFVHIRTRGLVNRRRVNHLFGPKKNRALPILPMSYQLSQSYYRWFSTRFPHSLFNDCFHFLKRLVEGRAEGDRPITFFHQETDTRSKSGEELIAAKNERTKKPSQGKEDERTDRCPDQEGDERQKKVETDRANPEGGSTAAPDEHPPDADQRNARPARGSSNAAPGAANGPPDTSDMMAFTLDSPGGACGISLSLVSLGLLSVYISIPKQIVLVDSNLVDTEVVKSMAALEEDDEDEDDNEDCEGRKKMEVKAHQASHTKYLMMRGYCSPGIVNRLGLNTTDNIVVDSCIMKVQLRSKPAHQLFPMEDSSVDLFGCGPSLLPSHLSSVHSARSSPPDASRCELRLVEQRGYTSRDMEAFAQLRGVLDAAGEVGVDKRDLCQTHAHLEEQQCGRSRSLQQYLKDLEEEGLAVRVGSLGVRWVLMEHAEPWLLTVSSKHGGQPDVSRSADPQQAGAFRSKRCRRHTARQVGEPPAKRTEKDGREGEDAEELSREGEETENREREDEEASLDLEEGGELQGNTEGTEAREQEPPAEETPESSSAPPEAADADDDENVRFISRPWRLVDSNVNRSVCKGMLESIMCHVMSRPGITQETLLEHFKAVLQPVALLDLLQALIDMGCVTEKRLVKCPKPSLFSRSARAVAGPSEAKAEAVDPQRVYYEPTLSCCLRLSQVLPNEHNWNLCQP